MTVRRSIQFLLILLVLGCCVVPTSGQSPYDRSFYPEAFLIRDHLEVFTDRSIYVVGESIQFRADHRTDGIEQGELWSTVVYVELVTSSGKAVSQGKFSLSGGMASGILNVPGGALTGNYFLKSYTRWMRNSGSQSYSYTPLKIINPFNAEVSTHVNGSSSDQLFNRREYMKEYLDCSTRKTIYKKGEEVQFSVSGSLVNDMQEISCCVTVVPAGGVDVDFGQIAFYGSSMDPNDYLVNYLPDLKGVNISGTVVESGNVGQPLKSAILYFSILGDLPDFFVAVTDAHGRFVISTPEREGIQEFFVAPDPSASGGSEVRIDQDFDTGPNPKTAEKFKLSVREHELATHMALQMQLSAVYNKRRANQAAPQKTDRTSVPLFYGTPGFSILMDDFVTLPTLEEVFINLIPDVEIVVRRGQRSMRINGPNRGIYLYPPLIMIDHLPVFDQQVVLDINPEKIRRIDLINEVYVKGSVAHGGVISILSRNGDMAGIDLSANSYFFDFQSIQPFVSKGNPSYAPGDRVPDMRNTFLWLEDIAVERGLSREIAFKAPSAPGEYVILVRGLARQGTVLSATARFVVE